MQNAVRILALSLVATGFTALAQQGYKLTLAPRTDDVEMDDKYFETSSSCVVSGRSENNPDGTANMLPNQSNLMANNIDLNYVRFNVGNTIRAHHFHPGSHPPDGGYPDDGLEPPGHIVVEDLDLCTGTKIGQPPGSTRIKSVLHVLVTSKKGQTLFSIFHYAERYSEGSGANRHFETFNVRTDQFQCASMTSRWECDVSVNTVFEYQHNHPGASQTTTLGTRELRFHMKLEPPPG